MLDRLKLEIENARPAVVSFDFFDTLCLRRTENPTLMFFNVAEELKKAGVLPKPFLAERFVALRSEAESRARRLKQAQAGTPEVSLREIYLQLKNFTGFERRTIADIAAIEEEVELKNLILYDRMVEVLRFAASRGCTTAVVSDSYLPSAFFTRAFDRREIDTPTHLFVSNELGCGKGTGAWPAVLGRLRVEPHRVLHVGDNYAADVEVPSKLGIRTFFVPHGSSELFSTIAEERRFLNNRTARFVPTSISTLRAKCNVEAGTQNAYVAYGYQTLGSIYSYYAAWAMDMARHAGAARIVPLAREGVFLAELFENAEVPLSKPLSVSRRFMRLIDFRHPTREKLDELFATRRPMTRQALLERVQALTGEFVASLNADDGGDAVMSAGDKCEFLDQLWADKAQIDRLAATAREQADRFRLHLEQVIGHELIGAAERTKVALIDVGWNGSIQRFLDRFCSEEKIGLDFVGLYIMSTPAVNAVSLNHSEAFGFLIDGGAPTEWADIALRNLEILEQSATPIGLGSLLEFTKSGAPREMNLTVPEKQRQQISSIQQGIVTFNRARLRLHPSPDWSADVMDELRAILIRAMVSPTEEEASLFAEWRHDDNILEDSAEPITEDVTPLLPYMTPRDFLAISMTEQYWPFPNLTRGPAQLRRQVLSAVRGLEGLETMETGLGTFEFEVFDGSDQPVRSETTFATVNLAGRGLLKIVHAGDVDRIEIKSALPDHTVKFSLVRVGIWDQFFKQSNRLQFAGRDVSTAIKFGGAESGVELLLPNSGCTLRLSGLGVPYRIGQTVVHVGYEVVPASMRAALGPPTAAKQISSQGPATRGQGWIDTINGTPATPDAGGVIRYRVPRGSDIVEVTGWLLGAGDSTAGTALLGFEDAAGKRLTVQCIRAARPDLSTALKRKVPDDAGIRARIDVAMIRKKGTFRIILFQLNAGLVSSYVHPFPISFE
ncbi:MAG: hypothetical protein JNK07_14765 [Alphaproteobacteria bacterium]|nr:hypothetical protein [Alphaproteobacteria bacterium]